MYSYYFHFFNMLLSFLIFLVYTLVTLISLIHFRSSLQSCRPPFSKYLPLFNLYFFYLPSSYSVVLTTFPSSLSSQPPPLLDGVGPQASLDVAAGERGARDEAARGGVEPSARPAQRQARALPLTSQAAVERAAGKDRAAGRGVSESGGREERGVGAGGVGSRA